MVFESVRGFVELASGLGDLTRARAQEAAHSVLSLPAAGVATSTKVAGQASVLADALLAAATANRSNLTALVRSEVDIAITALGLVPVQKFAEVEAEAERLRAEVARLRSAAPKAAAASAGSTVKAAAAPRKSAKVAPAKRAPAKRAPAKGAAAKGAAAKVAAPKVAGTAGAAKRAGRSAVTTRAKPAGE